MRRTIFISIILAYWATGLYVVLNDHRILKAVSYGKGSVDWLEVGNAPAVTVTCLTLTYDGKTIFLGTPNSILASRDGKVWDEISTSMGSDDDKNVTSLLILRDGTLLAGTQNGQVFMRK